MKLVNKILIVTIFIVLVAVAGVNAEMRTSCLFSQTEPSGLVYYQWMGDNGPYGNWRCGDNVYISSTSTIVSSSGTGTFPITVYQATGPTTLASPVTIVGSFPIGGTITLNSGWYLFIRGGSNLADLGGSSSYFTIYYSYIDCGLRVYNGSQTITIACEPSGTLTSPLRIRKGSTTYGIVLTNVTDAKASNMRIQIAGNYGADIGGQWETPTTLIDGCNGDNEYPYVCNQSESGTCIDVKAINPPGPHYSWYDFQQRNVTCVLESKTQSLALL